jgi:RNA polymerase sigma-70 factor, ECF subfamily
VLNSPSQNNAQQDQELVQRVQQGNKVAFDFLVIKYQHRIIRLLNRYINDLNLAQDLAQEVFVKAYRAIGSFREASTFYTWLYRIAINTVKNDSLSRSRHCIDHQIAIQTIENQENLTQFQDLETPEIQLLNQELLAIIKQTINNLPDEMRIAITLYEFDNLSYEEIAHIMDCPVGTIRSRIFRAREAINHVLNSLLTCDDMQ